MHTWETMMSTAANYEHNWHNVAMKSEPVDGHVSLNESDSMSPHHFEQKMMFEAGSVVPNYSHPLGFNPLTPPGYPNVMLRHQLEALRPGTPCSTKESFNQNSFTPTHTPPMDVTPPKSPKDPQETPEKDQDQSECGDSYDEMRSVGSDFDDDSIKVPKVNSHGKIKTYKCKQCGFVAVTKVIFWEHTKAHIKPEKMLACPKCPFVTEYKHHLEYHLRNHQRSKPFQCPKCSYSCVNKSMLNSHLKSHSSVFQYRCADCNYATKYCHSLKLHLRKYSHKPDVVLNIDGTPNPLPIIDVYGTRRGPKAKPRKTLADEPPEKLVCFDEPPKRAKFKVKVDAVERKEQSTEQSQAQSHPEPVKATAPPPPPSSMLPNALANILQNPGMPLFPYLNLNFQMFAARQQAIAQLSPGLSPTFPSDEALNLVQNRDEDETVVKLKQQQQPPLTPSRKDRRKGRAYKLDRSKTEDDEDNETNGDTDKHPIIIGNPTPTPPSPPPIPMYTSSRSGTTINNNNNNNLDNNNANNDLISSSKQQQHGLIEAAAAVVVSSNVSSSTKDSSSVKVKVFECKFCGISFKDDVLYTIHMGYHGYNDVFKCNMCGEKCEDRVSFFLHIARSSHT